MSFLICMPLANDECDESGTNIINTADTIVPINIKGVLFPYRLANFPSDLSDSFPKIGSKNKDNRLSKPIINPLILLSNPYACSRSNGITKSYAVQNTIIIANAIPTFIVCG